MEPDLDPSLRAFCYARARMLGRLCRHRTTRNTAGRWGSSDVAVGARAMAEARAPSMHRERSQAKSRPDLWVLRRNESKAVARAWR
jgi:hypothetical protein